MEMKEWLAIVIIIAIVLVLADGFRRKLRDRNALRVKLEKNIPGGDDDEYGSELPNGGARAVPRTRHRRDVAATMTAYNNPHQEEDYDYADQDVPVLNDAVDSRDDYQDRSRHLAPDYEAELGREDEDDISDDDFPEEDDVNTIPDEDYEPRQMETRRRERQDYLEDDGGRIEPSFGAHDDFSDEELADERLSASPVDRPEGREREEKPGRGRSMRERLQGWSRSHQGELPFADEVREEEAAETPAEDGAEAREEDGGQTVDEVIVINVMAPRGEAFSGQDMLPVLMRQGMRLGDMSIFHRHADASGNGPVIFSMANMVKPGTFDMSSMNEFTTPGVSLFMQLPSPLNNMQSFDKLLDTARALKDALGGDLKDENRSVLTRQTIEHYRQRIRDFELRQLARK